MKQTLLLLFTSFSLFSFSQDSAKVLFIGNSYTHQHNVPQLVANIASNLGDYVFNDMQTAGGATLENHTMNSATFTKIQSQEWDYVVIQAQSVEPSVSDAQVNANTLPYAIQLADSVYANNFCSEVLFYMTWGRENGFPQWQPISTFEGMQTRLRSAYLRFADSVQGSVSPVGMAWKHVRDNHPGIQLYSTDGSHASAEGAYLTACTFYASIFRKPSSGATFYSSVNPTIAGQLQAAADFVVLDSLDHWNLRDISEHTQAEFGYTIGPNGEVTFDNQSTKAQTYSWDFGDGQVSTDETPTVTYGANGIYTVTLTATSPCDDDVVSYDINVNTLGLQEAGLNQVTVKSHGQGVFELVSNQNVRSIDVAGATGNQIMKVSSNVVDLSNATPGIYFLRVLTDDGEETLRVMR